MERRKTFVTALVGLGLAMLIWLWAAWDDLLGLGNQSNSYLPGAALFVIFLFALAVNPFLRRFRPNMALGRDQMVILGAMIVMAASLPALEIMRKLPGLLVAAGSTAASNQQVAALYDKLDLPAWLFPTALEYGARSPVLDHFIDELPEGARLPWGAWLKPCIAWGCLFAFAWMFMIGLAAIVYPQWRENERVTFPVALIYRSQIEEPEEGRLLAPLFYDRGFWAGIATVFILYSTIGLHAYFPNRCPAFPLDWNLGGAFSGLLMGKLPGQITNGRIFFVFVGMAFLIPRRIGFSIWFFAVAYGVHEALCRVYFPPYAWQASQDHNYGAMLAIAVSVLWIGRKHWARVARCTFGRAETPRDRANGAAARLFLAGAVGLAGWLTWVGVPVWWALLFVLIAFLVSLVAARIVAETGMPFLRFFAGSPIKVLALFPYSWMTAVTVYFCGIVDMFFHVGSRVNTTVYASQALAVEKEVKPQHQTRNTTIMLIVLLIGFLFYGAVTVRNTYNRYQTLNLGQVLGEVGMGGRGITGTQSQVIKVTEQETLLAPWARMRGGSVAFGAVLAGLLQWGCIAIPWWPLHPVGLVIARQYYSNVAWPSMFLGWLLQIVVVRYCGARVYGKARTIAIGLILGEVLAIVFWRLVASELALLGVPYLNAVGGAG